MDPQPADDASPNRVAVGETAIQIDSDRFWQYAAVNLRTNNSSMLMYFPFGTKNFSLTFQRNL